MERNHRSGIISKPPTIHRAIANVILFNVFQLGGEYNIAEKVSKRLNFYGIKQNRKTIILAEDGNNVLADALEPDTASYFNTFISDLQSVTLRTNLYGSKRLKQMCNNMDSDMGFYFAYMSVDLEQLGSKGKDEKQRFLFDLKKLINKYSQESDTLDLYD